MPEKQQATSHTHATQAAGALFDPFLIYRMNQRAFDSWMRAIGEFSTEICRFAQSRLQEDANTWSKFMSGSTRPPDALECQRQYIERMTKDYFDEGSKLSQLAMQIANDGFSLLQARSEPAQTAQDRAAA